MGLDGCWCFLVGVCGYGCGVVWCVVYGVWVVCFWCGWFVVVVGGGRLLVFVGVICLNCLVGWNIMVVGLW